MKIQRVMKKSLFSLIIIIILNIVVFDLYATVRYAKPSTSGSGTSWVDASGDLQLLINNSSSGDEIWVAAGTYKPNRRADATSTITANDRNTAFVLKSGVKIYGGFVGTETISSQRSWITNVTTLSGDLGTVGTTSDNAYHVVISSGAVGTAELNGFTISDGNSNLSSGIMVYSNYVETFKGGGVVCFSSSPILANLNIVSNYGTYGGGMILLGSSPTISGVTLSSNSALSGGGILISGSSSPTINGITVINNAATTTAGDGGGIFNESASSLVIYNALIAKNTAGRNGGGYYNINTTSTLINTTIANNSAITGGGMMKTGTGSAILNNCIIWGNIASTSNNIDGSPTYNYSLLEGGTVSGNTIKSNANPQFVDATGGNYRLLSSSPAKDIGNNSYISSVTTDLGGSNRISNSTVDLGAYEYNKVWYVTPAGAGTTTGTSWTNAASDLQLVINNAASDDEIWVAQGTYKPIRRADALGTITVNNRNNAFVLRSGVKIYGGFAGTETLLLQRNWITNITTLSGDLGTVGNTSDNAYHVVISSGAVGTAELNGFTVTLAQGASGSEPTVNTYPIKSAWGGGVFCTYSSPVLSNLIITSNYAEYMGGGVYITNSSPLISNTRITYNTANQQGGGVFITSSSSPAMQNVMVNNNYALYHGGGIRNESTGVTTITNALIYKNTSGQDGAGISSTSSTTALTNATIVYNTASSGSVGGIEGGGVVNNSIIWGNKVGSAINNVSGSFTYSYTLLDGGTLSGTSIISNSNPTFTDISTDNYHLKRTSPVVNKGLNSLNSSLTDLDGNSRIFDSSNGGVIDLGAYEYQSVDATVSPFTNGIMYVKKGATGDGTSWSNAIGELSDALSTASGSGFVTQIWVAAGTYYPGYVAGNGSTDRDKSFVLLNNIKIYGGFAGNESSVDVRNFRSNVSVLSGDLGTVGNVGDNAFHVIISSGSVGTAELNGFTISDGQAVNFSDRTVNSNTVKSSYGGGIYCISSSPILSNLIIKSNYADYLGGGIYNSNSSPTLTNNLICKNTSGQGGAGVNVSGGTPLIINSTIANNAATSGYVGGIDGSCVVKNSIIWGNTNTNVNGSNTYSYTLLQGGIVSSPSIISISDPQFMNSTSGDFSLMASSPAKDVGNNSYINGFSADIDGSLRIVNSTVDLGAYEFHLPVMIFGANGITDGTGYTTLKGAFDALNAQTNQTGKNISVVITASTVETVTAVLNGNATTQWSSLKIYPNTSGLSITGNVTGPLIDLNGADNVTVDGRVNAAGSTKSLIISNTNTTNTANTSTIRFVNDASINTVQHCIVKGSEFSYTSQSGVIFFSTGVSAGNDNNVITNNDITNAGGRPINAIYSLGTSGKENNNITISNNNIYDCMSGATNANSIYLSLYTTTCSITGNNIYETTTISPTVESTFTGININNASGDGFTISNNNIGGNSASCTGTWTKTNSNNTSFQGIYLSVGTSAVSEIQNNTIKGFNWSNSIGFAWYGIWLNTGSANIGTTTGNTIGSTIGNGSISVANINNDNNVYAVNLVGSGNISCSNNKIGSISTNNTSTNSTNLYAIKNSCTGTVTISNNLIGSTSTTNSLYAQSTSTGAAQSVWAIYNSGSGSVTISSDTIANLTNSMTGSTVGGVVHGIFSSAGINTISNNIIHDLTNANSTTSSNNNASVGGIVLTSSLLNSVSNNNIYNLYNTNTAFSGDIVGLYFTGSTGANTVSKNFIYGLSATGASSTSAEIYGIKAVSGVTTYSNNIISLGGSNQSTLYGIYDTGSASQTCNLYFNTIYLSGTVATGNNKSYCLYSESLNNTRNFRDNIFFNARSTTGGGSLHYAAKFNYSSNASLVLNYNDYYVSGTGGVLAYYNGSDKALSDIVANSTGWETSALSVNPNFTTPNGITASCYRPLSGTSGIVVSSINDDYQNVTRTTPTIGAFEVNNVEVWKGTLLAKYATLRSAFNAINAGTHTGALEIRLVGSTVETGPSIINASGVSSSNYSSLTIYPTVTGCSISMNMTTTLFVLNGANNVTLDGRVNQTGIADLTLSNTDNTSFSSRTVVFQADATANTIKYCYLKGASISSTGAVVWFSQTTGSLGNNNNTIDHCYITNSGSRPTNGIVSIGNLTYPNSGNVISNNNIYNILRNDESSKAIYIGVGSTGFTITGNSIYETTTLTPTVSGKGYYLINIENVSGNNFTIADNYIGGSAPLCAGSAFTVNTTQNYEFRGISVNVGSSVASTIENNYIRNFNYTSSFGAPWSGIYLTAGAVNVGTVSGNTIGSPTGTGSITITNPTVDATSYGVYNQSTSLATIQKNNIGSITTTGSDASSHGFIGLYKQNVAGDWIVSSNIIGSTSTANSIQAISASTSTTGQIVEGIQSNGSGNSTLLANTIANLYNAYAGTNVSSRTRGIEATNGANAIQNNVIRNISTASGQIASDASASVIGVSVVTPSVCNQSITGNVIYNIFNTNLTAKIDVLGIYSYINPANTCTIANNFIHSLSLSTSDITSAIDGISYSRGLSMVSNNVINIGIGLTKGYMLFGINNQCSGTSNSTVYFNTVYLGGSASGVTLSTYALYEKGNATTRDYRNNILYNARTGGTTGAHYAIYLTGKTNLTVDYNDYFSPAGLIGNYVGVDKNTIALWRSATNQDIYSYSLNPTFTNAGSITASDYKIGVNLVGALGTGISSDYGTNVRSAEYTAMGAWEHAMTNYWKGTSSTDWATNTNWTLNALPPTYGNIEFDATPVNNCVMDKDYGVTNITNSQSTYKLLTNGHRLTVKGNLSLSNGAQIDASASGSTVEFGGVVAQSIPNGAFANNNVYNLSINNSNNVTFNGTLNLLNTITSTLGELDAMTNSPTICYAGTTPQLIDSIPFLNGKAYNLTIDNAAGVSLSNNFVVDHLLTINSGKLLTIATNRKLNILGSITNNAGVTGLVIKSGAGVANGTLIFHNSVGSPVSATVEMYSKAAATYTSPYSGYKWQFFGIPLRSVVADPTFTGSYIRQFNEPGITTAASWVTLNNSSTLTSFKGYEITQAVAKTIVFQGVLENADLNCDLTYTSNSLNKGQHIISNPYTAAIDIAQLNFTNMEASVYLYNTGSHDDWSSNSNVTTPGTSPGQYVVSTKNSAGLAGIPAQISSMQGFMVTAYSGGGNLSVPYNSLAVKNADIQRVKQSTTENKVYTIIDVKGARYSDKMWLFTDGTCSHNFDNGWDGYKVFGAASAPQIYAMESDGNYQINAVDDVDNTVVGFQAGEDSVYTFTFNHQNLDLYYKTLLLVDSLESKVVDISQNGSVYNFKATSNSATQKRFKIVTSANISTESNEIKNGISSELTVFANKNSIYIINNTSQCGDLILYDMKGQVVLKSLFSSSKETVIPMKSQSGVYLVKVTTAKVAFSTNIFLSEK